MQIHQMVVDLGEEDPRQSSPFTACMAQVGSAWPTPVLICLSDRYLAGI
jgi:hypothetical protein